MPQTRYRIIAQAASGFDVEASETGNAPRALCSFNIEAEAWQWVAEQERVTELTERRETSLLSKCSDKPQGEEAP
jgi:hypothetical protein